MSNRAALFIEVTVPITNRGLAPTFVQGLTYDALPGNATTQQFTTWIELPAGEARTPCRVVASGVVPEVVLRSMGSEEIQDYPCPFLEHRERSPRRVKESCRTGRLWPADR